VSIDVQNVNNPQQFVGFTYNIIRQCKVCIQAIHIRANFL
jgi:hypothetical protein